MTDRIDDTGLARYLSGECSNQERLEVEAWIREEPARRAQADRLARAWETPEDQAPLTDVDGLWRQVAREAGLEGASEGASAASRDQPVPRGARASRLWRYAAVLVAGLGLSYFLSRGGITTSRPDSPRIEAVTAAPGERLRLVLEDGTVVVLDAGSTLTYPAVFAESARRADLEGEGYFEVTADPQRPFVVRAGQARLEVLGTRFNVSAWPQRDSVELTVAEGRVALGRHLHPLDAVVVEAGQGSALADDGALSPPRAVDVEARLAWMADTIAFASTPLAAVLHRLERWHGVRFTVDDPALLAERVTVTVRRGELGQALELVAALTGHTCRREGDAVRLVPPGVEEARR